MLDFIQKNLVTFANVVHNKGGVGVHLPIIGVSLMLL